MEVYGRVQQPMEHRCHRVQIAPFDLLAHEDVRRFNDDILSINLEQPRRFHPRREFVMWQYCCELVQNHLPEVEQIPATGCICREYRR